jgi:hypothetical protein
VIVNPFFYSTRGKKHQLDPVRFDVHSVLSRPHVSPIASIWKEARWSKTYPPVVDLERQEEEKHIADRLVFWRSRERCSEERVTGRIARYHIRSMQKATVM